MTGPETYEALVGEIVALTERLPERDRDPVEGVTPALKAELVGRLRRSLERRRDGGAVPRDASSAALVRLLVDGNGPRDPRHPLVAALERLDGLAEAGRMHLLPRTSVRELRERDRPLTAQELRRLEPFAVLVPTATTDGRVRLAQLRDADDRPFLGGFTDRALFDRWNAETSFDATLVRIADLVPLVVSADLAGIVLNPLDENLVVARDSMESASGSAAPGIDAGATVSYGAAAQVPDRLRAAATEAAAAASVDAVYAVSLVEAGSARLVWVVTGSVEAFAKELAARVGTGIPLDLLDGTTAFGRTVVEGVAPLYERPVTMDG